MRPGEPGLTLAVGVSGAGKTYSVKADVFRSALYHPIIVIDVVREWSMVPPALAAHTAGATSVRDAIEHIRAGRKLVIVAADDPVKAAVDAAAWAVAHPTLAGVAIPEAHRVCPNGGRLPLAVDKAATAYRHHGTRLWLDTQRLARIDTNLSELARVVRIFAQTGDVDFRRVRDLGEDGRALEAAVRQCARRLDGYLRGTDPDGTGWHVPLTLARTPPYTPTRDPLSLGGIPGASGNKYTKPLESPGAGRGTIGSGSGSDRY